mgnify:CR=1 FL=1
MSEEVINNASAEQYSANSIQVLEGPGGLKVTVCPNIVSAVEGDVLLGPECKTHLRNVTHIDLIIEGFDDLGKVVHCLRFILIHRQGSRPPLLHHHPHPQGDRTRTS